MKKVKCINARRSFPVLEENKVYEVDEFEVGYYYIWMPTPIGTKKFCRYLKERFAEINWIDDLDENYPVEVDSVDLSWIKNLDATITVEELNTPSHYDNSKGTLYKVAQERGWNAYLFDIVKRLERAEKKGEFQTDLEKSINVIKLWMSEKDASDATK